MKTIEVKQDGEILKIPVCESCLKGDHISYGYDHRQGEIGRRSCKNLSEDRQTQCCCDPDWPELMEALEKEISNVRLSNSEKRKLR